MFILSYKDLIIGFLEFSQNINSWKFTYSEEFKNQDSICPILLFPYVDKIYVSNKLWSFFLTRIPDFNDNFDNKTLIDLLIYHGKKTITNPFILNFYSNN
jgi:hypothetical protein